MSEEPENPEAPDVAPVEGGEGASTPERVTVPEGVESTLPEDAPLIQLPLFEGPLDLLLYLIRREKIDIYDIPIAPITRQYMEYLDLMRELNLDVAGEFLVMAATWSTSSRRCWCRSSRPRPRATRRPLTRARS